MFYILKNKVDTENQKLIMSESNKMYNIPSPEYRCLYFIHSRKRKRLLKRSVYLFAVNMQNKMALEHKIRV